MKKFHDSESTHYIIFGRPPIGGKLPPGGATDRFIRLKGVDSLLGGGNLPFPTDNCPVADGAAAAQPLVAIVCS